MVYPGERTPWKPQYPPSIQHFSHNHQLQLLNTKKQPSLNWVSCAGCKLQPSEWVYACKPCNFILHIPCSQMPKLIHHPADPNHTFTLLAKPAYPTGLFGCDACGKDGDGFNFHCSLCGIDLHTTCAIMPLSLSHQTHHCPLNLIFSPPYPSKEFSCDVCREPGSNHWVYRCDPCGFDAHLHCAANKPSPSTPSVSSQYQTRSLLHPQPQNPVHYRQYVQPTGVSAEEQARQNFIQNFAVAQQEDEARILSFMQNNDAEGLQNFIRGNNSGTSTITQQYLQSTRETNNSRINSMTQQIMQGMSGGRQQADPNPFASYMGGTNGGGGGAGEQFNEDFMQNVLGDRSGDGAQDFLQNVLGDGSGGGGLINSASTLLQTMFGGF